MHYIDGVTGIWSLETAKKRHRYDVNLAEYIAELYKDVNSIADIGCGTGNYCKCFKDKGIPIVHGYEGTVGIQSIALYNDIMTIDLSKNRWVDMMYDLVICLEVGEHLPKPYEQVCINNICRYVSKDLILSWAIPGQGGAGHFNELSNGYIIREFAKRGFAFDRASSLKLREMSTFKWFKHTLMKFEKV